MRIQATVAALVCVLGLTACDDNGSSQDTAHSRAAAAENAGMMPPEQTAKAGEQTPQAPKIDASAADGKVHLPDYLTLYSGANVTARKNGTGDPSVSGGSMTFTTPDAPKTVVDFYKAEAEGQGGMHQQYYSDNGGAAKYVGVNIMKERALNVDATKQGGTTTVTLNWTGPKK